MQDIDMIDDIIDQASREILDMMPNAVGRADSYPPRDTNTSVMSTQEALDNYFDVLDDLRSAARRLYEAAELDQTVDDIVDEYAEYDPAEAFDIVAEEYDDNVAYEVAARLTF